MLIPRFFICALFVTLCRVFTRVDLEAFCLGTCNASWNVSQRPRFFFLIKMTQCWWLWLNWTENAAVVVGVQPVMMIIYIYIYLKRMFLKRILVENALKVIERICPHEREPLTEDWKQTWKVKKWNAQAGKARKEKETASFHWYYLSTYEHTMLCVNFFLYQSPEKKHVVLSSSHHHHQPASRQLHGKLGEELVRSSKWKGWIHHILIVIQPYTQAISTMSCRYWSSLSAIFSWRVDHHRYRHTYFCAVCVDTPIQVYYYFQIEIEMENHHVVFVACPFYSRSDNLLFCPYKIYSTTFILFHFPFHLV